MVAEEGEHMTDREISEARIALLKAMMRYMAVTGTRTFRLSDLGIDDPMTPTPAELEEMPDIDTLLENLESMDPKQSVDPMQPST